MPRVVAEVPESLKKWFQWETIERGTTMSDLIQVAMEEFKEREGEVPSTSTSTPTPTPTPTPGGRKK